MRIFLLIIFALYSVVLPARQLKHDSSAIDVRAFNEESINRFRQDKDFQYDRYKEPPQSLWKRFWNWVWYKVDQVMRTRSGRTTVYTIFIVLGVAAILFFIIKVTGMNKGGLFARNSNSGLDYNISTDNIHQISFDTAIQQAISLGNFRLATRLLYLQALKNLSDNDYISWQINKTNSDYIREVIDRPWHSLFKTLTWKFEYAWYGERIIGKEDFEKMQLQFQQFNKLL